MKKLLIALGVIAMLPVALGGLGLGYICVESGSGLDCEFSPLAALQGAGAGLLFGSFPVLVALFIVILPLIWIWRKLDGIRIGKRGK